MNSNELGNVKEVAGFLALIRDAELIEDFLRCLLTNNELNEIDRRWELVKRLDRGISQRQIARDLGMSLCKITRGSKELKKQNSAFKRILQKYC